MPWEAQLGIFKQEVVYKNKGAIQMAEHNVKVGEVVVYHDPVGKPHNALITTVHGPSCVNLVYVSSDSNKQDNYGRQIERQSSCCHAAMMGVHGNYWRYPNEQPNPVVAPLEK